MTFLRQVRERMIYLCLARHGVKIEVVAKHQRSLANMLGREVG